MTGRAPDGADTGGAGTKVKPGRTGRVTFAHSVPIPDPLRLARYRKAPELGPRVLFFSGGTALNRLSEKLIEYTHNSIHLITAFDSGGSSARLRQAFDMLSVGDLRSRLMALADRSVTGHPEIYRLFKYRLPGEASAAELKRRLHDMADGVDPLVAEIPDPMRKIIRNHLRFFLRAMPEGFDLRGASVGNLILVGGYLNNGEHIDPVVFTFSKLVEARGTVRAITGKSLHLVARLQDGTLVKGQRALTGKEAPPIESAVEEIHLAWDLKDPRPAEIDIRNKVNELIERAELICYPMGSYYSSLIANLLPCGVAESIAANPCPKVYVPNTGRDPEQHGMSLTRCVDRLQYYLRRSCRVPQAPSAFLDFVILDSEAGVYPGPVDLETIAGLGVGIIDTELVTDGSRPHIDEERLIGALLSLT